MKTGQCLKTGSVPCFGPRHSQRAEAVDVDRGPPCGPCRRSPMTALLLELDLTISDADHHSLDKGFRPFPSSRSKATTIYQQPKQRDNQVVIGAGVLS